MSIELQQQLRTFLTQAKESTSIDCDLSSVRIAAVDVLSVLQRTWYVTSGLLFISEQITQAELIDGLTHLHHDKALSTTR